MNLTEQINKDIVTAMKAKDKVSLEALRAIKSALLLAASDKPSTTSTEETELKMLQKLVKQRKDAAEIYRKESREELAKEEEQQIAIIEKYLPEQLSEEEVKQAVLQLIDELGAKSMADMGKVMGKANRQLGGKADGKMIAEIVKSELG